MQKQRIQESGANDLNVNDNDNVNGNVINVATLNDKLSKIKIQTKKQIPKQWTPQNNIQQAKQLKEQGNKFYIAKNYQSALRKYHQAILHLAGIIGKGSPMAMYTKAVQQKQGEQANALKFSIYSNMSQIYINQLKYDKGLQIIKKAQEILQSSQFLKDDAKLSKLHYRRGVCLLRLNYFQQARRQFELVLKFNASMEKEIQKLMIQLKEREKIQLKKSQKIYQNIFK